MARSKTADPAPQERLARALCAQLGGSARVSGGGVNSRVSVEHAGRSCTVHCFWYGDLGRALALGMNPSNTRTSLGPRYPVRTGAEYLVELCEAEQFVVDGRTQHVEAAIGAVREWLDGRSRAELERAWPFVDAERRRMNEVLAIVAPSCRDVARCEVLSDRSFEAWVYGAGRSCRLFPAEDGAVAAAFLLGPAQIAFGDVTANPAGPVSKWVHGASLAELLALGITSERHAHVLEAGEPARWHWLHTRDRIADPQDVLARSRPLLERLAERELPTRFFSYSSLWRFCFSASSHFPWLDDDLPRIDPPHEAHGYVVEIGSTRDAYSVERAIEVVERSLASYPVAPFFGSAAHATIAPLDAALANAGSSLRGELRQRAQWFDATVTAGERWCTVAHDLRWVSFRADGHVRVDARFATVDDSIAAIRCWLEHRRSLDEIRQLPSELMRDV